MPGLEGFYVGLLHPFSTPGQALVIVALGLLLGGFEPARAKSAFPVFLIITLLGLWLSIGYEALDTLLFATAFAAATLAALAPSKVLGLALILTGVGGLLIGDSSVPDAGSWRDRLFTMSGSYVGANIGLLYLFGMCLFVRERISHQWVSIAFRVAAAWVGALSLLMLALGFAATDVVQVNGL